MRTREPIDLRPFTPIPAQDSDLPGAQRAPAPADLPIFVIPTKAGIRYFRDRKSCLDPGFCRSEGEKAII